jgi:hypothetical protein
MNSAFFNAGSLFIYPDDVSNKRVKEYLWLSWKELGSISKHPDVCMLVSNEKLRLLASPCLSANLFACEATRIAQRILRSCTTEVEVRLHTFLASSKCSASCFDRFTPRERVPGYHWIGGWMGLRACRDLAERESCLCRESKSILPTHNKLLYLTVPSHRYAMQSTEVINSCLISYYSWLICKLFYNASQIKRLELHILNC